MSYPEKLLADDETVVDHLHPHWITLAPAVLWFLAVCVGTGVGVAYIPSHGTSHTVLLIVIAVLAVLLLVWLTISKLIEWRATHYVFTTHRILIRRGVLHHTGRDIALQRVTDVAYSQTLFDRIVKAGTLTIESAGEHGQETLHNLPNSARMQQTLNRLIEQDADRRTQRGMAGLGNQTRLQPAVPAGVSGRLSAAEPAVPAGVSARLSAAEPAVPARPALPASGQLSGPARNKYRVGLKFLRRLPI